MFPFLSTLQYRVGLSADEWHVQWDKLECDP